MSKPAPPLDPRSAGDVRQQLEALLKQGVPTLAAPATGASAALIGIFARYAELIIERLNRAPDKNRLAFFDLIGATLSPPLPARVPLTFTLAPGATDAIVPAGTPVAAPAGAGREQPVLFETERAVSLTPARLTRLISWDAPADQWADHGAALNVHADSDTPQQVLFQGQKGIEHSVFIGQQEALRLTRILGLTINFEQQNPLLIGLDSQPDRVEPRMVRWDIWQDGKTEEIRIQYLQRNSSTYDPDNVLSQLTLGGALMFSNPSLSDRKAAIPVTTIAGRTSRWLRCRLRTPMNPSSLPGGTGVPSTQLPKLSDLSLQTNTVSLDSLPDASFANSIPLDVTSDFLPFGSDPKPGAVWYIASREVFSQGGGHSIKIDITSSNINTAARAACPRSPVTLVWEYWNGTAWSEIGRGNPNGRIGYTNTGFWDGTGVFLGDTGLVTFFFDQPPQPTVVRGVENYWIRVRIFAGVYERSVAVGVSTTWVAAPPSFETIALSYFNSSVVDPSTAHPLKFLPDALVRFDGMAYQTLDPAAFEPFKLAEDAGRSLYAGFELPPATTRFPQRPVSLYLDLADPAYGVEPENRNASLPAHLSWSYWNGSDWQRLLVRDETAALAHSGLIEFLPPADMRDRALFDQSPRYWLRLSWTAGDYRYLPRLRKVLQNAAIGVQASTVRGEVLGSSNGAADQRFSAARQPVLSGAQLEVREPALPSAAEHAALLAAEGPDAITVLDDGAAWLRWHEVSDFHGSGPRDRHYVLDHLSGEVRFGDGIGGLIPPRGAGNIRLASYRSGGGAAGNTEAGAIVQMKTSVPFVAGVSNPIEATGGVGAESLDSLLDRAPRSIRHSQRAVTLEDYQDLARQASPEMARCRCVSLLDLRLPSPIPKAGQLSLIVVPVSKALKPKPSAQLTERVRSYLEARRMPGVEVIVVGAEYVSVGVQAEVGIKDLSAARDVELAVRGALDSFLHPLTGGTSGRGWDFGRSPHRSDLYALLEALPGVDYVRTLSITVTPERAGIEQTDRFLVCAGSHQIDLCFGV